MILSILGNYILNFYTFPIMLVAAVSLGIGLATLLRNSFTSLYWMFLAFTSILSVWATTLVLLLSTTNPSTATFWGKLLMTVIAGIPTILYHFVSLMNYRIEEEQYYIIICYVGNALIGYLILFTPAIVDDIYQFSWGYYPKFNYLHSLYMILFIATCAKIIHLLYSEVTNEKNEYIHIQRNKTILIGTLIGYSATIDFFPFYGINIIPFGFCLILACLIVYAFAISEYNLAGLTDDRLASKIFMTINEAVVVTDKTGTIELSNEALETLLKLDDSELKGRSITDFIDCSEFSQLLPSNQDDLDEQTNYEGQLIDSEGKEYNVRLKVTPLAEETNRTSDRAWYVFAAEDITELTESQSRLEKMRHQHGITGLPNRDMLNKQIQEDDIPNRCNSAAYIIVKDLHTIKTNLSDEGLYEYLINSIASRLKILLPVDYLYHINENEFFTFSTDDRDLEVILTEKENKLNQEIQLGDQSVHLNYSIGISEKREIQEAIRFCQSTAVNDARNQPGTAITRFSEDVSQEHAEYFDVKHSIINAIREDRIQVHYHPQIFNGTIRGAEALIRWNHEQHGFIAPPKIVRAAIEMNYEKQLFQHVLSRSVSQAQNWDDEEIISVNIAAKQLEHGDRLKNQIKSIKNNKEFDTGRLEIELTEQAAMRNIAETRKILKDLKALNIKISIDDFGTGYSSFKSLIELPIDILKIDKSFIMNLQKDSKNKRIVETTREMADSLGLEIIAEGVESTEHINYLQNNGIEIMQGFYWTSPLSSEKYQDFRQNDEINYS